MTKLNSSTSRPARRTPTNPVAVAGFAVALLASALPLVGVQLWIGLTDTQRWGYTDMVFAFIALGASSWMLNRGVVARTPLYLLTVSSLAVIGGEVLYVYWAFHGPDADDYLTSEIWLLGNMSMVVSAVWGLFSSFVPRGRQTGAV
jgi:hypothetical protein